MVTHPEFGLVDSPANPDEFALLPSVGAAIADLNRLGLLVVVVSNQPGVAKGKLTLALLVAIEQKMVAEIAAAGGRLDAIAYCLHHPEATVAAYRAACDCRKPKPGLLLAAARQHGIDLTRSYLIGDGVTDVAAGQAAGATTIFVSSRTCDVCQALAAHGTGPDCQVKDLPAAVTVIRAIETSNDAAARPFVPACRWGDEAERG